MSIDKKDLLSYLNTLTTLDSNGFNCKNEIKETLQKLHEDMGFVSEFQKLRNRISGKLHKEIRRGLLRENYIGKLILVNEEHRQIGKSTMLVEESLEYSMPIVVKCRDQKDYLEEIGLKSWKEQKPEVYVLSDFRGREFVKGVLVDESLTREDIEYLKENKIRIRGGFYYDDSLI